MSADAEALLLGKDQSVHGLLPAARLHLARGDVDLARVTARRALRPYNGATAPHKSEKGMTVMTPRTTTPVRRV